MSTVAASAASCTATTVAAESTQAAAATHGTTNNSAAASASGAWLPQSPVAVQRILSIQSSVVYGYVGNKASNFPLQLLGFDVDPLHSCQLSNHTGHPFFSGYKTSSADVTSIMSGLTKNDMLGQYTHLLTGYMSSVEFLQACVKTIQQLKRNKPNMLFVCDPVMGDNSKLYVPEAFVSIYRDDLLGWSDVVTPNQTEAERLSGIPIVDQSSALANLTWFHSRGPRTVIITSMTYPGPIVTDATPATEGIELLSPSSAKTIHVMASTIEEEGIDPKIEPNPKQYAQMQFEYVPVYFSGTGDLTAALLLAWLTKLHQQEQQQSTSSSSSSTTSTSSSASSSSPPCFSFSTLVGALERSMSTLQSVIHRTFEAKSEELKLIQSKLDIEQPPTTHKATIVQCNN